jgi:hypothetical protein
MFAHVQENFLTHHYLGCFLSCLNMTLRTCLDGTLTQADVPTQLSRPQAGEIERPDALPGADQNQTISNHPKWWGGWYITQPLKVIVFNI